MRANQDSSLAPLLWHGTGLREGCGRFPVAVSTPSPTPATPVAEVSNSPRRPSGSKASSTRVLKSSPKRQSLTGNVALTGPWPPERASYPGGPPPGGPPHTGGPPDRPSTRDGICSGLRRRQAAPNATAEDSVQTNAPDSPGVSPGRCHSQQRHTGVVTSSIARPGTADVESEFFPTNATDDKGLGPHVPRRPRSRKPQPSASARLGLGDLRTIEMRQPTSPAVLSVQRPITRGKPMACFLDESVQQPEVATQTLAAPVGSTTERFHQGNTCLVEGSGSLTEAPQRLAPPLPPRAATAGGTSQGIRPELARLEDPSNRRRGSSSSARGASSRGVHKSGRDTDRRSSGEEETSLLATSVEPQPTPPPKAPSKERSLAPAEISGVVAPRMPLPAPNVPSTLPGGNLPLSIPRPLSTCGGIFLEDVDSENAITFSQFEADIGEAVITSSVPAPPPSRSRRERSSGEKTLIALAGQAGSDLEAVAPTVPKPGTSSGRRYRKQAAGEVRKSMMTKVDIERNFGGSQVMTPLTTGGLESDTRHSRGEAPRVRRLPLQSSLAQDFLDLFARH